MGVMAMVVVGALPRIRGYQKKRTREDGVGVDALPAPVHPAVVEARELLRWGLWVYWDGR